ncbi:MAG TPA: MFS transporter [Gemmatimonadaceae bacterium]
MTTAPIAAVASHSRTKLNRQQIAGFWAAWSGWLLDGMDSVIYALVLTPALTELLPRSGITATPGHVGFAGSVLFAVFLAGWGCSFIWGPIADHFGRTRAMAATIVVYALFTGGAAFADNVWQLGLFRFLAGVGVGGEWAMAGTYVAEAWPEDRRKMGAGYLQTGYYFGFFAAAALNYTVGVRFGWRAMFLCGFAPVAVSVATLLRVKEPERWNARAADAARSRPLREIFSSVYRRRTFVNAALLTVAIIGLWAGAVYEPAAITSLAKRAGMSAAAAGRMVSVGTGVLSIGTILGCLCLPPLAERLGRKLTVALYFAGMMVTIPLAFGWAFYRNDGLRLFIGILFFMGFAGGSFTAFSLWLPEQYETRVRATAFAFTTSVGRFAGAGVNFLLGSLVLRMGTLGTPVALTAIAFGLGILVIPFAMETTGEELPM